MNFILNPDPLPLCSDKKVQGIQYYQWQHKQRLQKLQQQQKQIQAYLHNIEKQQQEQKKQSKYRKRIHHEGTFYDYNMEWKKKVQNKIQEEKISKEMQVTRHEEKMMKAEVIEGRKQLDCQYKGPVEGWQEHFDNYLKNRSQRLESKNQELTFQPKINERSRKMAEGLSGKVEDRLILFGQFLKMKNQQQMNNSNISRTNAGHANQKYSSSCSNQSDLFYRLYKEGQQANKKRRQLSENDSCSFQPRLNKLPEQIQDKIMKRRKPLYFIKNSISNCQSSETIQNTKKLTKENFEAFLQRNEALLKMKKKLMLSLQQKQKQQQNLQKSKCTFTPILNKNSKKIQKQTQRSNKQFQQQLLSNISPIPTPIQNSLPIDPSTLNQIDISKLTLRQPQDRDSSQMEEDSLSMYRVSGDGYRYGTGTGSRTGSGRRAFLTGGNGGQIQSGNCRWNGNGERDEDIGGTSRTEARGNVSGNTKNISTEVTGNNQDDSIDKMRSHQWEAQLESIQNNLQNMMMRAIK